MNAHNTLEAYRAAKLAATAAKREANTVIATAGTYELPTHCDREAIRKTFIQLAKSNKKAIAVVDGIDSAKLFAEAEAQRVEKRALKMKAEAESLENAINSRLDAIMADDARRELLILEAQAAAEIAAQSGDVAATA